MWQTPVSKMSPSNSTPCALELGARRRDVGDPQRDRASECGAVNAWPMFVGSIR